MIFIEIYACTAWARKNCLAEKSSTQHAPYVTSDMMTVSASVNLQYHKTSHISCHNVLISLYKDGQLHEYSALICTLNYVGSDLWEWVQKRDPDPKKWRKKTFMGGIYNLLPMFISILDLNGFLF